MDVHDRRDGEDLYRVLREEVIPLYYQRESRRPAARLDQAHEEDDPDAGLALRRQSDGDGLHAEMLCPGGQRHVERYEPDGLKRAFAPVGKELPTRPCEAWRRGYARRG
jgi:hypothetical protein